MSQQLSRTFGLKDLIMIVIGTVIGSGRFRHDPVAAAGKIGGL